jgi:hypothetical protein
MQGEAYKKEILSDCLMIVRAYNQYRELQKQDLVAYDPVKRTRVNDIVESELIAAITENLKFLPEYSGFESFPRGYKYLLELTEIMSQVNTSDFEPYSIAMGTLDNLRTEVHYLRVEFLQTIHELTKSDTNLSESEIKAKAWDYLPATSDWDDELYLVILQKPLKITNQIMPSKSDMLDYRVLFRKDYLNGVCVGWKFVKIENR